MNRRVSILLISLLLASGCDTLSDLTKGDDNVTPPTPLTPIAEPVKVSTMWSRDLGKGGNARFVNLKPVEFNGRLYVAGRSGNVTAFDTREGRQSWEVDTNTRLGGGPGAGENIIAVGSSEGEVIALDAIDGHELWRSRVTSEVLSVPAIGGGVVVARAIDGRVFGLSAIDGKRLWTYDRTVPVLTLRGSSSPVIAGGLVIYGSDSGKLVTLSLKDGLPLWEKSVAFPTGRSELDRIVDIDGDPLVINGVVYAASYQGNVVALQLETGRSIWSKDISTAVDIAADKDNLYISDAEGIIWALDRQRGSAVWKQDKLLHRDLTGPTVVGKYVVVGDLEGYLHWISRDDGQLLGRTQLGSAAIHSTPLSDGETVYGYSSTGNLAALRAP